MYYYKARIYSPRLGRFLQVDPIGYEDQYNLYAYVGNDPVNGTDPTGLAGCSASIGTKLCSAALKTQKKVISDVKTARSDLANLKTERAQIASGDRGALSSRAQNTRDSLKDTFDSATNEVVDAVDATLASALAYLQDPGTKKGGSYNYRGPNFSEKSAGANSLNANHSGWVYSDNLTVVVLSEKQGKNPGFASYSDIDQRRVLLEEVVHGTGMTRGPLGEWYGSSATARAKGRGGTSYAVYHNAHSYACFLYGGC